MNSSRTCGRTHASGLNLPAWRCDASFISLYKAIMRMNAVSFIITTTPPACPGIGAVRRGKRRGISPHNPKCYCFVIRCDHEKNK